MNNSGQEHGTASGARISDVMRTSNISRLISLFRFGHKQWVNGHHVENRPKPSEVTSLHGKVPGLAPFQRSA